MQERNDLFTVAFDRTLNPGGALGNVVNPATGQRMVGGLVYASDSDRAPGRSARAEGVAARRHGLLAQSRRRLLRAGYGIYWAPWNYQAPNNTNYGQIGASQVTETQAGQFFPTTTLSNPFPSGLLQPIGNSLGALTGVGGTINFIDQDKKAPYVHMYSVDLTRELPGNIAVGFEYAGATGVDLGLGGSNDGIININQVPYSNLSLGAALNDSVPNPFFGLPAGQGFNVTSATIPRRQLLRPFPQFGDILMRQSTLGKTSTTPRSSSSRSACPTAGAAASTTPTAGSRTTSSARATSSRATPPRRRTPTTSTPSTASASSTCRTSSCSRRSSSCRSARASGGRRAAFGRAILGDWVVSSVITLESGFPISLSANSNDLSGLGGRCSASISDRAISRPTAAATTASRRLRAPMPNR